MIGGTDRREGSINRTDGHIETLSQLSQILISTSFDRLIYQNNNERTHWQKGAEYRKEDTHHQDRMEEYTGGEDASTGWADT